MRSHGAAPVSFELRTFEDPSELAQLWQDLEQRADPTVFLSWDWIGCWVREALPQPVVVIGRAGERIVLLGVLAPKTRRILPAVNVHGLWLQMTGDPRQDVITIEYNGFLVERDLPSQIQADAIAFLLGGQTVSGVRRKELHLKNVPAALELPVRASGFGFRELARKPSWRIDLAAIRVQGKSYLDCLSANTRQQIRRSMRLYEKRGPLAIERADSVSEALMFLDRLKQLHQEYWEGRGEPGAFSFPFFAGFQLQLIETCLHRGTIELAKVTAGADVIGYVYNLVYRGHVYAYQTGIRYEADPKLKPGLVSHCLCIQRHLDEGDHVYDFMAGEARYKANLGQPGPEMVYLLAERPAWPLQLETALQDGKRWLTRLGRRIRATG